MSKRYERVCVCVYQRAYVCVCVCVCCYHFVLLVVLMELIFSHDSLKTLSFDQHLMCTEQVSRHIINTRQA